MLAHSNRTAANTPRDVGTTTEYDTIPLGQNTGLKVGADEYLPKPAAPAPEPGKKVQEQESLPEPPEPTLPDNVYQEPRGKVASGSFAELRQLIPQAF